MKEEIKEKQQQEEDELQREKEWRERERMFEEKKKEEKRIDDERRQEEKRREEKRKEEEERKKGGSREIYNRQRGYREHRRETHIAGKGRDREVEYEILDRATGTKDFYDAIKDGDRIYAIQNSDGTYSLYNHNARQLTMRDIKGREVPYIIRQTDEGWERLDGGHRIMSGPHPSWAPAPDSVRRSWQQFNHIDKVKVIDKDEAGRLSRLIDKEERENLALQQQQQQRDRDRSFGRER